MKCGVCKYPLMKVSTRTVNRRRVPIYAKCPRLFDPEFHPARATTTAPLPAPSPTAAGRSPETMRPDETTDGAQSTAEPRDLTRREAAVFDRALRKSVKFVAQSPAPVAPQPRPEPKELTDEQIDRIAENCAKAMPDGIRGFCKTWGWRQFARELLDVCAGHRRACPSGKTSNEETGAAVDDRDARDAVAIAAQRLLFALNAKGYPIPEAEGDAMVAALAAIAMKEQP